MCGFAQKATDMCNDPCTCSKNPLLDHLVGAGEQRERKCDAKRFGSLEVEDQLDSRLLLDRHVGWLVALENAAGVDAREAIQVPQFWATVAHQSAGRGERAKRIDCGHGVAERLRSELLAPSVEKRIVTDHEPACLQSRQACEGRINARIGILMGLPTGSEIAVNTIGT